MSASRPPDELRARVLAAIGKEPAPARPSPALATGLALGAVVVFLATSRMHGDERPRALVIATSAAALLAGMVVTRGVAGRLPADRPSMLPPARSRLVSLGLAALAALVAIALAARSLAGGELAASDVVAPAGHVACAGLFVVQGLLPLAVLALPRRGQDPRSPALTGAALGAAAGVWAAMLAWIRCPHVDLAHGVLAHALPVIVLAAIGAAVGKWLLRMR